VKIAVAVFRSHTTRTPCHPPKGGVARSYKLIPGIEPSQGTVTPARAADFAVGEKRVSPHGYDIGTGRHGGYATPHAIRTDYFGQARAVDDRLRRPPSAQRVHRGHERQRNTSARRRPRTVRCWFTGAKGEWASVSVRTVGRSGLRVIAITGRADRPELPDATTARPVIGRLPRRREDPAAWQVRLGRSVSADHQRRGAKFFLLFFVFFFSWFFPFFFPPLFFFFFSSLFPLFFFFLFFFSFFLFFS